MNDIFHVRTSQRLGERMVWLEPLFYFICFAENRTWARGGAFSERNGEWRLFNLYIAKGGPGVKYHGWSNTRVIPLRWFFCPLIPETRCVYSSFFFIIFWAADGAVGVRGWRLSYSLARIVFDLFIYARSHLGWLQTTKFHSFWQLACYRDGIWLL